MEVMKQLRQRAIRDLVGQRPIRTQQELAAALRERGFRTTQATISRDVAELGLIKVTREGMPAYALPPRLVEAETSGEERLRKLLADLPVEIHEAGLLLVLRTLPARRTPSPPRSTALAGPRSRARSPATTRCSSPCPTAARCSASSAACIRLAEGVGTRSGTAARRALLTPIRPRDYHSRRSELQARGTTASRLEFFPLSRPPERSRHIRTTCPGATGHEQQAHLPVQGRPREAPRGARRDGQRQAARGRQADPRRQGARRPLGERRVRGRQERAGVRRGPDPDARGADQERHDHRREPLDRPRPDRLDRRGRERPTARRRSRSSARPRRKPAEGRISNESPVGRALLGKKKGEKVVVKVPAGDFTYKIVSISSEPRPWRGDHGLGRRTRARVRDAARRSSTTRRRRPARSTSAACAARSSSTRSPAPCARTASRRRSSTASTTSTRWTPRRS